ncbi:class I SAM-dependent methyltransferase [Paenibacillus humicola]|uniref:class I SAM-dependent methyltransferase n=1 Tax=Paenibacillus humicola TaxID=3110540 RepID=UPI00237A7785|nr:class I SAM-dependent methyltransferase [Paenibacillus humicola]
MPDFEGKRVCVPSSGDNHAVYAFHLMGAQVTSCDISERQLENSSSIAQKHGWDIEFICADTMKLCQLDSDAYDFVYTSNGVHVWIFDLNAMYQSVHRILKGGGTYIMFDVHPFMRPFGTASAHALQVVKPYDAGGPFEATPTFHWRVQDMINAMMSSGLSIRHMEEMYAENGSFWEDQSSDDAAPLSEQELADRCNWKLNPLAALPQWLSVQAVK